ncbi:hypothetical protein BDK51DRAFT_52869 [Blyttiomyces helicus]|uniref:Uncharacterized protein n=1 Tax=Blyttiomyces helicus TaxID=388810 RepID=A0A4V1IQ34_9FUNG|nr:hypothetical protein BDK51DRAFT_52869 [Blyttiomyces helicus]|eukprot:RKO85167.1 hypothetical protein BDK51DRAFT_52869 [Blyttiomyces helicus]
MEGVLELPCTRLTPQAFPVRRDSVSIARSIEPFFEKGYGVRDAEGRTATARTGFSIASLTQVSGFEALLLNREFLLLGNGTLKSCPEFYFRQGRLDVRPHSGLLSFAAFGIVHLGKLLAAINPLADRLLCLAIPMLGNLRALYIILDKKDGEFKERRFNLRRLLLSRRRYLELLHTCARARLAQSSTLGDNCDSRPASGPVLVPFLGGIARRRRKTSPSWYRGRAKSSTSCAAIARPEVMDCFGMKSPSASPLAPALHKVYFTSRDFADDRGIIDLVSTFSGIEELDASVQKMLTVAALVPLHSHRHLKVVDIRQTNFTADPAPLYSLLPP